MDTNLLEQRDELVVERGALIRAMTGKKNMFVAVFSEELPARWDWLARAWFAALPAPVGDGLTGFQEDLEVLSSEARAIAQDRLSAPGVWGHEESSFGIAVKRPYAPTGDGRQWSHVSPAIASAEEQVLAVLEQRFGEGPSQLDDWESGEVSDPLAEILTMYAESFAHLQKVEKALKRVRQQLPRPRPNVTRDGGI